MATLFRMPGVSADADEAVLEAWTVQQGATISSGQAIASVETEKAVVEVESDVDAVVHALLVANGATVPVGDPIAVLLEIDEDPAEGEKLLSKLGLGTDAAAETQNAIKSAPEEAQAPEAAGAVTPTVDVVAPGASSGAMPGARNGGRVFASPIARKLARERGIDFTTLSGTGPGGRIVRDDVLAAASAPAPSAAPAGDPSGAPAAATPAPVATPVVRPGWSATPHSKLRKLVASRLQASKQQAPHFYLRVSLRVDELFALRAQLNAVGGERISVNDFLVKAAAKALIDVPEMNVVWSQEAVLQSPQADIAVAVASDRGLVTPVISGIENLSLSALSRKVKDAVARANDGKLQQSELEGGTLTISNLGMYGVEEFDAIINPPQAGILAVGAAVRQPVIGDDGEISAATIVKVVLSVDHRPVDGVVGARWLARFKGLIENPIQIVV
jgi:pyruvate dehydrogenase E2 component (dihydrolipoamide acetyltransferase)